VKSYRATLLIGGLVLVLAGCGGSAVPLTGTVTRDGQPLQGGVIAFEPEAGSGTTGAGANTAIKDGKFALPRDKALPPGKYVVRVSPEPLGSGTDLKTAPPQFKPWETKIEIKSGSGPLTFDVPAK